MVFLRLFSVFQRFSSIFIGSRCVFCSSPSHQRSVETFFGSSDRDERAVQHELAGNGRPGQGVARFSSSGARFPRSSPHFRPIFGPFPSISARFSAVSARSSRRFEAFRPRTRCDSDALSTSASSEGSEEHVRPPPGFENVTPEMLWSTYTWRGAQKWMEMG